MADEKKPAKKQRTWVKAPVMLLRAAVQLSVEERFMLLLLLVYANPKRDEGEFLVWPSNGVLAKEFGCHPRRVAKILEDLERKNFIRREVHGSSRRIVIKLRCPGMEDGLPDRDDE